LDARRASGRRAYGARVAVAPGTTGVRTQGQGVGLARVPSDALGNSRPAVRVGQQAGGNVGHAGDPRGQLPVEKPVANVDVPDENACTTMGLPLLNLEGLPHADIVIRSPGFQWWQLVTGSNVWTNFGACYTLLLPAYVAWTRETERTQGCASLTSRWAKFLTRGCLQETGI
jgi:hypothetical protein